MRPTMKKMDLSFGCNCSVFSLNIYFHCRVEQTMFMCPFSCNLKIEKKDIEQRRRGIEQTTTEQIFVFGHVIRVLYSRLSFRLPCSSEMFILDVLQLSQSTENITLRK